MDLSARVLAEIRKNKLIKPGTLLVLGVSGGADSVFLAHCFHRLRHDLSVRLHMAHFNHKARSGAGRDQKFVEDLARSLNIPLTVGHRKGKLASSKLSEDEARQKRFDFFVGVAAATKGSAVVLAHTENDLAETVLMRLVRGTGLQGLRGILPQRAIKGVSFVRPLIGINRSQIEGFLKRHKLKYCTDETNARPIYLRNKIRLELVPYLARLNPNIHTALVDLAGTALDDYDYLETQARQRFKESVVSSAQRVRIKIKNFAALHTSMRRLILRLAFEHLTGDTLQLTCAHVLSAEDLISNDSRKGEVHWPKSVVVAKRDKFLEIHL